MKNCFDMEKFRKPLPNEELKPCPYFSDCNIGDFKCYACGFNQRSEETGIVECGYSDFIKYGRSMKKHKPEEPKVMWRRAKAGRAFGKDTIVLYDNDPDARLVKCAVNDCYYIHIEDLKKLPKEN